MAKEDPQNRGRRVEIVSKEDAERGYAVPSSVFARWSFTSFPYSGHHLEQGRQTCSALADTVPGQCSWCERGARRRLPIKSVNVRLVLIIKFIGERTSMRKCTAFVRIYSKMITRVRSVRMNLRSNLQCPFSDPSKIYLKLPPLHGELQSD